MPCHAAMIKKLITVRSDETVEGAMKTLKKNKIDAVPVVNEDGTLEGVFGVHILLKNLLPVSVNVGEGLQIDMKVNAAPGVAKRLKKVKPLPVSDLMERKVNVVSTGAPLWEGLNLILSHGAPVLVVEENTGKLKGMITEQSMIDELERVQDE